MAGTGSSTEGGRPESSRDRILETAHALFARHGFAGVGLREVAQRVGLGKSSLFHHFPTKVHLYVAVVRRALLELERQLIRPCSPLAPTATDSTAG